MRIVFPYSAIWRIKFFHNVGDERSDREDEDIGDSYDGRDDGHHHEGSDLETNRQLYDIVSAHVVAHALAHTVQKTSSFELSRSIRLWDVLVGAIANEKLQVGFEQSTKLSTIYKHECQLSRNQHVYY